MLHDLPVPTSDLEWKQLYREMGSFFAAEVFLSRTPQVVMDLPVADIHDSTRSTSGSGPCVTSGSPSPSP